MYKLLIFSVFFSLSIFSADPTLKVVNNFDEVYDSIDENTLVVLDIDDTVLSSDDDGNIIKDNRVQVKYINTITDKIIYLTARSHEYYDENNFYPSIDEYEETTSYKQLKGAELLPRQWLDDDIKNMQIIYTSRNLKGEYLLFLIRSFIEQNISFNKIVFIDDSPEQMLLTLSYLKAQEKCNTKIIGFLYQGLSIKQLPLEYIRSQALDASILKSYNKNMWYNFTDKNDHEKHDAPDQCACFAGGIFIILYFIYLSTNLA